MGIMEQKKLAKRRRLLRAAYELFCEKGVESTSVDDIVRRSDVAKGTFYLYFRDKTALLESLCMYISHYLAQEAFDTVQVTELPLADGVVAFADYVIEFFKQKPDVLRLLESNFYWALVENELDKGSSPIVQKLRGWFHNSPELRERTSSQRRNLVFILLETVGSVCYASIIRGQPDSIDQMKPILFQVLRNSLQQA